MITNIKINGFKSFLDFTLDVPPFLALIGPNASGKSNLFDALTLMADAVEFGPQRALTRHGRGSALDMFHRFNDGTTVDQVSITVTMLAAEPGDDGPVPMTCRLVLEKSDGEPFVSVCDLSSHAPDAAADVPGLAHASDAFMASLLVLIPEPRDGRVVVETTTSLLDRNPDPDLIHQARAEARSWRPYVLEPHLMRLPVPAPDHDPLALNGRNLAAVLHRLEEDDVLWKLRADLIALIPGLRDIKPLLDQRRQEYDFDAVLADTGSVLPRVLSDGTLRALGLLAVSHDARSPGVMVVEEVENGFHPGRLAELVRRLTRDLVDPSADAPITSLRQVIVTSHSPVLVSALWAETRDSLRFTDMVTRIDGAKHRASRVTRVLPILDGGERGAAATPFDVRRFLGTVRPEDR
ncbi:AAA family ATPase [Actinocorallia sp. A-T 12471]|uniref:AAA family ATPase n=1 Tax=Actinocorallia sp. A-T 12471 TaxID=3089813 RepID=UPI0029CD5DD5|nr:AAA family ATPase [Actinocorallia sp. A-T 12471]MDX6739008.1 AAA family ATPase [Actinocorallia sp. A-T 12471]